MLGNSCSFLVLLAVRLIIANGDDVLMTSVAYDAKHVIWVSAGAGWLGESVTCPPTNCPRCAWRYP